MMNTWMLAVRGTAEVHDNTENLLHAVYRATSGRILYVDVDYPASIGPANPTNDVLGVSLAGSIGAGVANLNALVEEISDTDRIVLVGYSLGALVVLHAAENGTRYDRIITVACPSRTSGLGWGRAPRPGYTGIAADYMPEPRALDDVCHIVNPNDGITCLHPQSPLRRLVPYLWALDLDDWAPWAGTVYAHLTGWRRLLDPRAVFNPQAWGEALPALDGYLHGGQHTTAYRDVKWEHDGQPISGIALAGKLVDEVAAR